MSDGPAVLYSDCMHLENAACNRFFKYNKNAPKGVFVYRVLTFPAHGRGMILPILLPADRILEKPPENNWYDILQIPGQLRPLS